MKRNHRITGTALALLAVGVLAHAGAFAQIGPEPDSNARHSRIVGVWDVQTTLKVCGTDITIASFPALHKYERGGTGQVVPATSPAALSPHLLVWSHVLGNDYLMAFKMFRFDPAGNYLGWIVVNAEVSVDEKAEQYEGSGTADIFDSSGSRVGGSCPEFSGSRFTGDF